LGGRWAVIILQIKEPFDPNDLGDAYYNEAGREEKKGGVSRA